jgi:PLP dependent protein
MVGRRLPGARRHRSKPHLQAMNGNPSLEQRYLAVTARIRESALAAGRDPGSVRLLAVSKTFPAGQVEELAGAGQLAFGENYLQEALGKIAALEHLRSGPGLEWHFIGPIQSNKTRRIAESFDWVQSVDDEKTARRLSAQRPAHLPPIEICLQVNVSGETSKSGCDPERTAALALEVAQLPQLRLRGLMAIPEATTDAGLQARRFAQLRRLFEKVRSDLADLGTAHVLMDTLSMGMSSDLEAAIAEGATLVRVGSALFGARAPAR